MVKNWEPQHDRDRSKSLEVCYEGIAVSRKVQVISHAKIIGDEHLSFMNLDV